MAIIRWTEEAATWLEAIHRHVATDDTDAARQLVNDIYDRIQTLLQFPTLGRRFITHSGREVRILLHDHYRIAYETKPENVVQIVGIFHGALDINSYL